MPFPWKTQTLLIATLSGATLISGCGDDDDNVNSRFPSGAIMLPVEDLTRAAKEAFITAESGDVIVFPEGRHEIEATLLFDGDSDGDGSPTRNITIMGYGKDETILDFSNSSGGDGIFVQNGKDIIIKDLAVFEAANNAIKLKDTDGIHIQSVSTVWEGELNQDNGAYGLYPVECQNILIEDSYVRGSADAGVYVGQSSNIVVRRNIAEENVAGIEIENSTNADVYDNIARKNTGGILVFDLPIGNALYGKDVRVFDNLVEENNTDNFANTSASAAGVHVVPPGTGILLLSASDVEVYHNTVRNHDTTSIVTTSYYIADPTLHSTNPTYSSVIADGWKAVPRSVYIHDNTIENSGSNPRGDLITDIIAGYATTQPGKDFPVILYDGLGELMAAAGADPTTAGDPFGTDDVICAKDNGNVSHGQVFSADPADNTWLIADPANPVPSLLYEDTPATLMACTIPPVDIGPSQATINGQTYGCGSDETSDPSAESCAL